MTTTWRPKKTVGQMVDEAKTRIQNLSIAELEAEQKNPDVQVLDIRDVRERRKLGFIPARSTWRAACSSLAGPRRTTTRARRSD